LYSFLAWIKLVLVALDEHSHPRAEAQGSVGTLTENVALREHVFILVGAGRLTRS